MLPSYDLLFFPCCFAGWVARVKTGRLYHKCLEEMARVSPPGTGRAVLLTQDKKCMVQVGVTSILPCISPFIYPPSHPINDLSHSCTNLPTHLAIHWFIHTQRHMNWGGGGGGGEGFQPPAKNVRTGIPFSPPSRGFEYPLFCTIFMYLFSLMNYFVIEIACIWIWKKKKNYIALEDMVSSSATPPPPPRVYSHPSIIQSPTHSSIFVIQPFVNLAQNRFIRCTPE